MKAEDLSIGLWINVGHCHSNIGGDYDVEFIPERLTLEHFKFWIDNKWDKNDFDEFIKPIQITEEILEKNGFKKKMNGVFEFIFNQKNTYIKMEYNPVSGHICANYHWFIANEIYFVHELQHALKMAKVDKEVEL